MSKRLTREATAAWLKVSLEQLASMIASGLPIGKNGMLDPDAVAAWIQSQGLGSVASGKVVRTMREVAEHFETTEGVVRKEWRPNGMPGRPGHYDLDAIAAWKIARPRDPQRLAALAEDPLMKGHGSPALERYREARAKMAELDFQRESGQVVDVEAWRADASRLADILRRASEVLQAQFGPDAEKILQDALDEWVREMEQSDASPQDPAPPQVQDPPTPTKRPRK